MFFIVLKNPANELSTVVAEIAFTNESEMDFSGDLEPGEARLATAGQWR